MRKQIAFFLVLLGVLGFVPKLYAQGPVHFKVTVLVASNQGSDFDLENDQFKDRLIQLFSYTSYRQLKAYSVTLSPTEAQALSIPGEYELKLHLKDHRAGEAALHVVIEKGGTRFLETDVSLRGQAPLFLGGPPFDSGVLIVALERI